MDDKVQDLESLKVVELKDALKNRNLPVSGNKRDLVQRLKEHQDQKNYEQQIIEQGDNQDKSSQEDKGQGDHTISDMIDNFNNDTQGQVQHDADVDLSGLIEPQDSTQTNQIVDDYISSPKKGLGKQKSKSGNGNDNGKAQAQGMGPQEPEVASNNKTHHSKKDEVQQDKFQEEVQQQIENQLEKSSTRDLQAQTSRPLDANPQKQKSQDYEEKLKNKTQKKPTLNNATGGGRTSQSSDEAVMDEPLRNNNQGILPINQGSDIQKGGMEEIDEEEVGEITGEVEEKEAQGLIARQEEQKSPLQIGQMDDIGADTNMLEFDDENVEDEAQQQQLKQQQQQELQQQKKLEQIKDPSKPSQVEKRMKLNRNTQEKPKVGDAGEGIIEGENSQMQERPGTPKRKFNNLQNAQKEINQITTNSKKPRVQDEVVAEKRVVPKVERRTTALRINNFVRPFKLKQVEELLLKESENQLKAYWFPTIKNFCLCVFKNSDASEKVRQALYDLEWPIGNGNGGRLHPLYITQDQAVSMMLAQGSRELSDENMQNIQALKLELQATTQKDGQRQNHVTRDKLAIDGTQNKGSYQNKKDSQVNTIDLTKDTNAQQLKKQVPQIMEDQSIDDIFKKTQAQPAIYYLPLTKEEVEIKLKNLQKEQEKVVAQRATIQEKIEELPKELKVLALEKEENVREHDRDVVRDLVRDHVRDEVRDRGRDIDRDNGRDQIHDREVIRARESIRDREQVRDREPTRDREQIRDRKSVREQQNGNDRDLQKKEIVDDRQKRDTKKRPMTEGARRRREADD